MTSKINPNVFRAVLAGCATYVATVYAIIGKVPTNHVTMLTDSSGEPVNNILYDDTQFFFYNPLRYTPRHLRVIPVKKRLVREYKTKDGKNVEVVLVTRSQPKIAYSIDIYRAFGSDYGRTFLEKEAAFDIEQVVKDYNYDDLVQPDRLSEQAITDLQIRLNEAAEFFHINLTEMTVVFRDPLADDEY